MNLGELKPLLTTLLLPPAGPLVILAAGLALAWPRRRPGRWVRAGAVLALLAALALWLLSCHAVAVWLGRHALPQVAPLPAAASTQRLRAQGVQAIVVLGGGLRPLAPEYGRPQPSAATEARLRYGLHLARASGLPLAFAGGVGWGASGVSAMPTEAEVAQRYAQDAGLALRWVEDRSRDTQENAQQLQALLGPAGVRRIALVSHAWHLPRAQGHFERAGFEVLPAPMGFVVPRERPLLEWLPSTQGLHESRSILREWLALRLG